MDTYGISPRKHFKLFEFEGYQVLAHVSEDDDGDVNCVLEGCIPELNDVGTTSIKLGVRKADPDEEEKAARDIFDQLVDAETVVTGFYSQVGKLLQKGAAG